MDLSFKNIDDDVNMGLNNTICTEKKYYCKSKRVYLSEADAKIKRCLCKPSFDMIGVSRCAWLVEVKQEVEETDEYDDDDDYEDFEE